MTVASIDTEAHRLALARNLGFTPQDREATSEELGQVSAWIDGRRAEVWASFEASLDQYRRKQQEPET